ncbi:MAG: hypothetical protein IKB35_01155, partial [Clostridia bacterium]|nr:hypothetical protein [Clostridia bacterium]
PRLTGANNGIEVLCQRVRRLLELRRAGTPEKPYTVYEPKISGIPVAAAEYFVEGSRDAELAKIEEGFLRSNVVFVTHTNGYGKRSAVRHYVNKNRHLYKNCVLINLFEGSLRALFSRGINFENVNSEVFSSDNEDENIEKKAELLAKLNRDTLIIVPGVTVDQRGEGSFITDLLANLSCRMLIITESLPKSLSLIFPEVDCGRMAPEHLEELFYNWCPVDEYDRSEELTRALHAFFDKIGGHTYAVELTARALADEFGLYPEDIPARLEAIFSEEEECEEDSITALISGLYDTAGFTDIQEDILCCAALVAETPMDERTFLEFLKPFEVTPKELLALCEGGRWLRRDASAHTISIEPLLGAISLSKISREDMLALANFALHFCQSKETAASMDLETQTSFSFSVITTRLLKKIGAEPIYRLSALSDTVSVGGSIDEEEFEQTVSECRDFLEYLPEELSEFYDVLDNIVSCSESICRMFISIDSLGKRDSGVELNSALASSLLPKSVLTDMIESLSELDSSPLNRQVVEYITCISEGNSQGAIGSYLRIAHMIEVERAKPNKVQFMLLEQFGTVIAQLFAENPHMMLNLLRASATILEKGGSKPSPYSIFMTYASMLLVLCSIKRGGDREAEKAFGTVLKVYPSAVKSFLNQHQICHMLLWNCATSYTLALLELGNKKEAIEVYKRVRSADKEERGAEFCPDIVLSLLYNLTQKILEDARLDEAEAFIDKELTDKLAGAVRESGGNNAIAKLDELLQTKEAIEASKRREADTESYEYLDYYKTFGSSQDRALTAGFSPIADAARAIDLSSLSREELLVRVGEARGIAAKGVPLARWAPLALALIDEAGMRTLGYRYHRVQLIGALGIYSGHIAEIQNGEGKTYTIAAAAFLNYVSGRSVHVLDSSEYLTDRNYRWMRGALEYLGVRVGVALSKSRTMPTDTDVTYAYLTAAVMPYLRDELADNKKPQRLDTAIVDEADYLMVLEGSQSFGITAESANSCSEGVFTAAYDTAASIPEEDRERYFEINGGGSLILKNEAYELFSQIYGKALDTLAAEESALTETALLRAFQTHYLWSEGKEYHLAGGRVWRESRTNGSLTPMDKVCTYMTARREGVLDAYPDIFNREGDLTNSTTAYEYLKKYRKLSGTSATASALRAEFKKYYGASVMSVPPNSPIIRADLPPRLFITAEGKLSYLLELVRVKHESGQPVMVIAGDIFSAREISARLKDIGIENSLISGATAFSGEKREAEILGSAGRLSAVTVCTAVANRGVDILLGGNPKRAARENLLKSGVTETVADEAIYGAPEAAPEVLKARETYRRLEDYYTALSEGERQAVTDLGGLCVIGTECFAYLSTEQQVRGRCGRQSAPGESHMLFSLDDGSLIRLMGGTAHATVKKIFLNFGIDEMDVAAGGIFNMAKTIRKARERYQSLEFDNMGIKLPKSLYAKGKAALFGEKDKLIDNPDYMFEIIERALDKSKTVAEALRAHPSIPLFNRALDKQITYLKARGVKRQGELIARAYKATLEDEAICTFTASQMAGLLRRCLSNRFRTYIKAMGEEYSKASSISLDVKKVQRHMEDAAEVKLRSLLEDAVSHLLSLRYLPSGSYSFKAAGKAEPVNLYFKGKSYAPTVISAARKAGVAATDAAAALVEKGWDLQDALDYVNKVYTGEIR